MGPTADLLQKEIYTLEASLHKDATVVERDCPKSESPEPQPSEETLKLVSQLCNRVKNAALRKLHPIFALSEQGSCVMVGCAEEQYELSLSYTSNARAVVAYFPLGRDYVRLEQAYKRAEDCLWPTEVIDIMRKEFGVEPQLLPSEDTANSVIPPRKTLSEPL